MTSDDYTFTTDTYPAVIIPRDPSDTMHLEASIIRKGQQIDLKVYDDVVVHKFFITGNTVEYTIRKHSGELIAIANAELVELKDDDIGKVDTMIIRTTAIALEIRPGPDYTYRAHKTILTQKG